MSKIPGTPAAPLTRKHLARAARERRMQRYVIAGTIVVAVVVVGLIGFAFLDQIVLQPQQPVARVNGVPLRTGDFQKVVRFQRYQLIGRYSQLAAAAQMFGSDAQTAAYFEQQLQQVAFQLIDKESLGRQVLNNMIDDELIRQEAARRGLTVSEADVEAQLQSVFNFYPNGTATPTTTPTSFPTDVLPPTATVDPTRAAQWTPTPTVTPTATLAPTATNTPGPSPTPLPTGTPFSSATPYTAEGYATEVAKFTADLKQQTKLSEADFRRIVESDLYRQQLLEAIGAEVPTSAMQVHARHILVNDQATAETVWQKLKQGEDWSQLAAQYSTDTANKDSGGDLGWFAQDGSMVAEFELAAFNTPAGTYSRPVQTQFGWHIIEVLANEERALTATQLQSHREKAFSDWLQTARAATGPDGKPVVETFDTWIDHVPTDPALPTGQ